MDVPSGSSVNGRTRSIDTCRLHNNDAKEKRLMDKVDAEINEHDHDELADQHAQNSKKVAAMITITFLFFLVELVVGFVNRSIALLADSYHMLSDVMALTIALICLRISRRKSKKNGFGWVRAEVLGALVNGVFLLAMCFTISLESIGRLIHPTSMVHPQQVLIVGVIGLLINLVGIGLFHGGHGHSHGGGGGHGHSHDGGSKHKHSEKSHDLETVNERQPLARVDDSKINDNDDDEILQEEGNRTMRSLSHLSNEVSHSLSMIVGSGSKQHLALRLVNLDDTVADEEFDGEEDEHAKKVKEAQNLNMRGVFLHIISDAIGSVIVIATASLALWLPHILGSAIFYMDPALSLCLVTLICFSAYRLVNETASIILGRPPAFVNFSRLRRDLLKINGVAKVVDVSAWTLVANRHIATAKIEFCNPSAFDSAAPKIRKLFHRSGLHSLTMQPIFSTTCISSHSKISPLPANEPIQEESSETVAEASDEVLLNGNTNNN